MATMMMMKIDQSIHHKFCGTLKRIFTKISNFSNPNIIHFKVFLFFPVFFFVSCTQSSSSSSSTFALIMNLTLKIDDENENENVENGNHTIFFQHFRMSQATNLNRFFRLSWSYWFCLNFFYDEKKKKEKIATTFWETRSIEF